MLASRGETHVIRGTAREFSVMGGSRPKKEGQFRARMSKLSSSSMTPFLFAFSTALVTIAQIDFGSRLSSDTGADRAVGGSAGSRTHDRRCMRAAIASRFTEASGGTNSPGLGAAIVRISVAIKAY